MLQEYSKLPSWLNYETRPFYEANVHFQSRWLSKYVRIAIPIQDFFHSLTHHSTNHYVDIDMAANISQNRVEALDFVHMAKMILNNGKIMILKHGKMSIKSYSNHTLWVLERFSKVDNILPQKCLDGNKAITVSIKLNETKYLFKPCCAVSGSVSTRCECKVNEQDLERCYVHPKGVPGGVCHPDVYENDTHKRISIPWQCNHVKSQSRLKIL
jgi:hypothetical protein